MVPAYFLTASEKVYATAFANTSGNVHVTGSLRGIVVILWTAAAAGRRNYRWYFAMTLAMTCAMGLATGRR